MTSEITTYNPTAVMPVLSIQDAVSRYNAVVDFTRQVMKPDKDYGAVPGTDKPTLLKPGAEKLCSLFGLVPDFETLPDSIVDWVNGFFYLRIKCSLRRGGELVATGIGSCNSREVKYRYRNAQRTCPVCGKTTIIKGKEEYGGGWLCFAKKGGCGAKFRADDPQITEQQVGQIENPDPADLLNTFDKMAQKRALVAATLIAANASEFFTQDVEDMGFIEGEFRAVHSPEPVAATGTSAAYVPPEPEPPAEPVQEVKPAAPVRPQPQQVKRLPELIVEANLAQNIAHASQRINACKVAGMDTEKAIARIRLYQAWRDSGADKNAAAENAIQGIALP